MPLAPGTRLGPYEILAPIGAGGMGEVYRARDTRLNRDVAVKVSADRFSDRFEREAHSIAALNHPNICTLYDVGPNYLVMELVEGPTLADRIKEGAVPLEEGLAIAGQIADALAAAHEKGIVHRDLKPGNIKITPDGAVKVLDFGLAKMADPVQQSNPEESPTLTFQQATRAGVILGTAAYMSPEQARGKSVDRRADIWAFGVVLYEMLTGRTAFRGETITDVLAAVVKEEPDLTRVPSKVRRLLQACLQKDPKQRLQAIGDWWLLLEDAPQVVERHYGGRLTWALVAVLILSVLALGFAYFHRSLEVARVLRVSMLPPEKATLVLDSIPAISPDGRSLAFIATSEGKNSLWARDLDSLTARMLAGTEGAADPFWSPDSRYIGFSANGKLKKIDIASGSVLWICDTPSNGPSSWSKDDTIVLATDSGGLMRVAASGGSATPLTSPEQGYQNGFPWFLPDGKHFLYTALSATLGDWEKTSVYVADLDSKNRRRVMSAMSNVVYVPPGYLLFVRDGGLMAQSFDVDKLQATSDPVLIAERVDYQHPYYGSFSASQNGVLVYTSGGLGDNRQLTFLDRSGKVVGTAGQPGDMPHPSISPDGHTVVIDLLDPQTRFRDLWLCDLKRGTESRFTFNGKTHIWPVWSPDGREIAFCDEAGHVYQKAISGAGQEEALDQSEGIRLPNDWSRDGRYIIEHVNFKSAREIWVLPLFGDKKPFPYLRSGFNEGHGKLSPNGHWLAYNSEETKRNEIYVQSFPASGIKYQVSTNGGTTPRWSWDGKELFFIEGERKLMAAEVKSEGATFEASVPKTVFDVPNKGQAFFSFDVTKDGRFLIPVPVEQNANIPITVVVNWPAALKK